MIPIVSIIEFFDAAVSLFLGVRLYMSYRKRASQPVLFFCIGYFTFAMYWLAGSIVGVVVKDLYWSNLVNIVSFPFMYVTLALVVQIPFVFLDMPRWRILITAGIIVAAVINVISRTFNFLPYVVEVTPPYIYWKPQIDPWLEIMTGVAGLVTTLIFIATFVYLGWKSRGDQTVYRRSMLLVLGMISMFIGTIIRFVAFYNMPLIGFGVGAIFVAIGITLMASGILYEQRRMIARSVPAE